MALAIHPPEADEAPRQTRRCSALSAALGAGLGLLAAKQLGFQAKLAYNAAFVCGATAGAALGSARWLWQGKDVSFCGRLVLGALMCETFQQVVHNKFCNLLFRCNCTWEWAGGWDNCNVHNATGPRCPWCVARQSISWTTDCLPLALMLLTFAEANCRGWPWLLQLLLPVLSFLLLGHLARCACGRLVLRCQFRTEPPIGKGSPAEPSCKCSNLKKRHSLAAASCKMPHAKMWRSRRKASHPDHVYSCVKSS
ncbi:unnamed protein product [Effrenium voratum]|nr:unnamed protein product [Effrenium voratum]